MRIGLVDVDGHNFPNLALMKLSAYHKKNGDIVEFAVSGKYDTVYCSEVFTFTPDIKNEKFSWQEKIKGGTGYNNLTFKLSPSIEHVCPDYSLYNYEHAYGFLTRGCIRKCSWCIVPDKEGYIYGNADIDEFISDKKTAILMDNNVLASNWGLEQIEKIINKKIKIDFNQGLDARIIADNPEIARLLSKVTWLKPLRMACDHKSQMDSIARATELLRKFGATPRQYFVYVLVKDLDDALERVMLLKKLKLDPFAQPYINFEDGKVNKRLKQFARWVNCRQLRNVTWGDYKYGENYIKRGRK